MSDSIRVLWDDGYLEYALGRHHPMHPVRLELTMALAADLGVLDRPAVRVVAPTMAGDELLELVHDPGYVAAVRHAPEDVLGRIAMRYGLGTEDNPIFTRMHEASALITGGTIAAAEAVWTGATQHAVNIAGGLHHAMPDHASGFCVYNDMAVAIAWLLQRGVKKVAYVDADVHHGDGVQAAFYDDPRVLTVSLHESGYTLFPGTGFADEIGIGEAEGTAVNVALPAGTDDAGWLRAFHAVVPALLRAFGPEILVTQHGCDSHRLDPLADLRLTVDGQRASYAALHALAHELCGGRWVAGGGGGYEVVQVVPRTWAMLIAEMSGASLEPATEVPQSWRELAFARRREHAPMTLTDGVDPTYRKWDAGIGDVESSLDRAIHATRKLIWPLHGLDPLFDR